MFLNEGIVKMRLKLKDNISQWGMIIFCYEVKVQLIRVK